MSGPLSLVHAFYTLRIAQPCALSRDCRENAGSYRDIELLTSVLHWSPT